VGPDTASAFDPLTLEEFETVSSAGNETKPGRCVMPVPADAARPKPHPKLGESHARWAYLDANDRLLFYVCRWNTPSPDDPGAKEFRCLSYWADKGWDWKHPPKERPLYGLNRLAQRPSATVLICEGEKAADAANRIFPDHVVLAWSGGANAVGMADWLPLAGRDVTIWPDNDAPGRTCAEKLVSLLYGVGAARVSVVAVPKAWPDGWDLADDLPEGVVASDRQRMLEDARAAAVPEAPLPLRRQLPASEPFPIEALGALRSAAEAIHAKTQAPMAICGQSVLAVASLAAQAHADVVLPTGAAKPLSCFFVTVAASGERKTSCDDLALRPVRDCVDELRVQYQIDFSDHLRRLDLWKVQRDEILKRAKKDATAAEADLQALGNEPTPPATPIIVCAEPTIEGLIKMLRNGLGFAGLFSAEGATFIGGIGMSADHKLKTAGYLSSMWDGTAIDRIRAGDDLIALHGRRLAAHLMVQPSVAAQLLSDADLMGQGLLSRVLVSAPPPAAGSRLWREPPASADAALADYGNRIAALLNRPRQHAEGRPAELIPRALALTTEARALWVQYHDAIETECGPSGALAVISGLAAKLPEHAARLSAVLAMAFDPDAAEVDAVTMADGITLTEHYRGEAQRLFEAGHIHPDLVLAEKVLGFIRDRGGTVGLRCIYTHGPNGARDKATAQRIVRVLEDHRWLAKIDGGAEIDSRQARDAWRLRE
jgi:hypothetical protein